MFYRVVMQGRTLGGADIEEVKRQFVRVTGLPAPIAERLLDGMPQVVKRQVPQPDAERIVATLRAIGAAANLEREVGGNQDETPEGVDVIVNPLNAGPPTVIPGAAATPGRSSRASSLTQALETLREKWPMLIGGAVLVVGAVYLLPIANDLVADLRPMAVPVRPSPVRAPVAESAQSAVANATLLHGPWRCVDQRTGVSTYWSYGANGALIFHGDVLSDRPASGGGGQSASTGWTLDGQRLLHINEHGASVTYNVAQLSLSHLQYSDDRGGEIQCRRP